MKTGTNECVCTCTCACDYCDGLVIKDLQIVIHQTAKEKGWWTEPRSFGDIIALIHSEVSEALEQYRMNAALDRIITSGGKPEGIPIEFADIIIRVLDAAEFYGMDITSALELKMRYNETRPYRHGNKAL